MDVDEKKVGERWKEKEKKTEEVLEGVKKEREGDERGIEVNSEPAELELK